MASQKFKIARISDSSIHKILEQFRRSRNSSNSSYNVIGVERSLNVADEKDASILNEALSQKGYLINRAQVGLTGLSIHFSRGEGSFDTVDINYSHADGRPTDVESIKLVSKLLEELNIVRPSASSADGFSDYEASQRSVLEKLQSVSTDIIERNEAFARQKAAEYSDQRKKLEEEFAERKTSLEREVSAQRDVLKQLENELEKRTKNLDDRDNTHVRREIRRDLNKILSERLRARTLSRPSLLRELPVHLFYWALIYTSGYFAWTFSQTLIEVISDVKFKPAPETVVIWSFVKQALATLTFLSSIFLYLRWLTKQHQQFVDAEEEVRRYQVDFERASWVVETAFEWKRDQSTQIPEPLLTAISRELFSMKARENIGDQAPVDMLASALLGSASRVKLNTGIAEVEIDGKKLGKAKIDTA